MGFLGSAALPRRTAPKDYPAMLTTSPWGTPDYQAIVGPGITLVTTPRHGGFHLAPAQLAQVPLAWRLARFGDAATADSPWFEEDCDACMVVLTFHQEFSAEQIIRAAQTHAACIRPKLAPGPATRADAAIRQQKL
jgi:hypothetical protein